jgi:purine-binding chemotaxis protein CheW
MTNQDTYTYTQAEQSAESDELKSFLIFSVGNAEFGIDLAMVKEINKLQPVSIIPNAKPFCKGIINIRGTIVPVIDLSISWALSRMFMTREPALFS